MPTSNDENLLFARLGECAGAGRPAALATVVRTWGSSPRPAGSHLVVDDAGAFLGSVSGGCIEGAVIREAQEAIADGRGRLLDFGVSDEQAWEVGLACGGRVQVYVERARPDATEAVARAQAERRALARVTRLADGAQCLVDEATARGELALAPAQAQAVRAMLRAGKSGPLEAPGADELFVRAYVPAPRMLVIGAVHISQALAPMAALAGFEVHVIDPRRAFATPERFPGVELSDEWPDEAIARLGLDAGCALVALTHDPKLDDPALEAALRSDVFYIGALGSTRTHAKRVERLTALGLGDALGRIHAPIGLDLGGRSPAEIAVSILAQIIAVRHGKGGR